MSTIEIKNRYDGLAEDNCCLSCGSAVEYGNARPGEVCLDLGSGRGTDVLRMAQDVGDEGLVYGLDISEKMLEKAKKSASKLKLHNVRFLKTDLEKINLESASVDLLISNCTINHAANKQAVWNEIFRVLKPGGRFAVSDIYSTKPVPEKFRNDPVAVSECWAGAVTKQTYLETLIEAGFVDAEIIEESKPYPKGEIEVASFTIAGKKQAACCCC